MASGRLVLRAYGRTVGIEASAGSRALALTRLPPSYRPSDDEPEAIWRVRRSGHAWMAFRSDGSAIGGAPDEGRAVEMTLSDLELWVAEHARNRIFVHAGCVVVRGLAVLLPGPSMAGKTTLTAALVRAGATYYSDEYAVLDGRGLVRPYPRRLNVRSPDGTASTRVAVTELGGTAGRGPCAVGMIALLRFEEARRWSTKPLSQAAAVLGVLENTVPARTRPRSALLALERATAGCVAIDGRRGDADVAASRLIRILDDHFGRH